MALRFRRRPDRPRRPDDSDLPTAVKVLATVEYPPDGSHWNETVLSDPAWPEVESAVRRLDQHRYPFIHLQLLEDRARGWLSVIGGKGAFSVTGTFDGWDHWIYHDPQHGDNEVPVWTSDQGFSPKEWNVCYDIHRVLRIAKKFYETGDLDPSVQWEWA